MRPAYPVLVCLAVLVVASLIVAAAPSSAPAAGPGDIQTNGSHEPGKTVERADEKELTVEQKFRKRFPQPVKVGALIGLPVLDDDDSTIGYVSAVVRGADGKISLIVPYSPWFGWARTTWGKRPVAVPIEAVVILAHQLDSLEMARADFDAAPTWTSAQAQAVPGNEKTLIALGRR